MNEENLKDLLIELAKGEKQAEYLREKLAEIEQFEPYATFQRIDRMKKKFLTAKDIQLFLLTNKIDYTERMCKHFIHHYDADQDGLLSFQE